MIEAFRDDSLVRHVHLSDSRLLRDSGVFDGKIGDVEEYLRRISGVSESFISENVAGVVFIRSSFDPLDKYKVTLDIRKSYDGTECLEDILGEVISICFFNGDAHKISISTDDNDIAEILLSLGFIQEAVLHDEKKKGSTYKDTGLFYILKPMYKGYNYAFVPFQRGVIAIGGGMNYVDKVSFLTYGELPADPFAAECASYWGITDDEGKLLPRNAPEYDIDLDSIDDLPAEVIRAATEIKEFLLKKRDTFDINVSLPHATEFQISVWEEIRKIPYGATCSYEDIALKLTDNDLKKARKLTRAVGSACSDNPVPIIIPCHRVIGKNGMLMGFSGGIEFKDFLLQNELFASALPLY